MVVGLVLGLAYGLAGFVEYEVDDLASQIAPLSVAVVGSCLGGGQLCDGVHDEAASTSWKLPLTNSAAAAPPLALRSKSVS